LDALAARAARDTRREIAALERASVAGPWDPSLAQQLGELHLREGDLEGVVAAWGPERTVQTLLKLGRREPPAAAFQWFALARRAAPDDPRPPAAVAATYEKAGRLDEAAQALAEACLLQARAGALRSAADAGGTGLGTIAARLLDQSAPLPPPMAVVPSQSVGRLLLQAAALLEERADLAGALYAAQLAAKAAPGSAASWGYLAGLWERLGQPQLAAEARLRAPRGSEREVRSVP
jgi:hypothetical protein